MATWPSNGLMDGLWTTDTMRTIFADARTVAAQLAVETALARAEARAGMIPTRAAAVIAEACAAPELDRAALALGIAQSGNLTIPLVRALTAQVAAHDQAAAQYVHWGATSQDITDTGLMLQLRDALRAIDASISKLADACVPLAHNYRLTPIVGRTWLQAAAPTTFGLKVAGWLDALDRQSDRVRATLAHDIALQFGGAVGTLAALDGHAEAVGAALAEELDLPLPALPWHTLRDRLDAIAATLGLVTATVGKIARDLMLLMQTEVGEVHELSAIGEGGSSTMPQKQNSVGCAIALAAALQVPALVATMLTAAIQEHERGAGGWQAEWVTLPTICLLTDSALHHLSDVLTRLEVDEERMAANIEASRGQIFAERIAFALAPQMGKTEAQAAVARAWRAVQVGGGHLRDTLAADPAVTAIIAAADLDQLFDPATALGLADSFVARALAHHAQRGTVKG